MEQLYHLLTKGLTATASHWPDVQVGYGWVHLAAHLLINDEKQTTAQVQQDYQSLLQEMQQQDGRSEVLEKMIATFLKEAPHDDL